MISFSIKYSEASEISAFRSKFHWFDRGLCGFVFGEILRNLRHVGVEVDFCVVFTEVCVIHLSVADKIYIMWVF